MASRAGVIGCRRSWARSLSAWCSVSGFHMDWLLGSRLHLVDIVVRRGLTFVPIYVLGFAAPPTYAYLLFVSFQAVM